MGAAAVTHLCRMVNLTSFCTEARQLPSKLTEKPSPYYVSHVDRLLPRHGNSSSRVSAMYEERSHLTAELTTRSTATLVLYGKVTVLRTNEQGKHF